MDIVALDPATVDLAMTLRNQFAPQQPPPDRTWLLWAGLGAVAIIGVGIGGYFLLRDKK